MDPVALQDAISRGMGVAALKLGALCDAYRPRSAQNPLGPANRYLRLAASFNAEDPTYRKPSGYGRATWFGVFDSAYTRPGDYLSGPPGVFFIAAQQPLLPVLCVLTNRTLSAIRPASWRSAAARARTSRCPATRRFRSGRCCCRPRRSHCARRTFSATISAAAS